MWHDSLCAGQRRDRPARGRATGRPAGGGATGRPARGGATGRPAGGGVTGHLAGAGLQDTQQGAGLQDTQQGAGLQDARQGAGLQDARQGAGLQDARQGAGSQDARFAAALQLRLELTELQDAVDGRAESDAAGPSRRCRRCVCNKQVSLVVGSGGTDPRAKRIQCKYTQNQITVHNFDRVVDQKNMAKDFVRLFGLSEHFHPLLVDSTHHRSFKI